MSPVPLQVDGKPHCDQREDHRGEQGPSLHRARGARGEGDSSVTAGIGAAEGMLLPANLGWDKLQGDIQGWKGLGVTGSEWDSGWEMDLVARLPGGRGGPQTAGTLPLLAGDRPVLALDKKMGLGVQAEPVTATLSVF